MTDNLIDVDTNSGRVVHLNTSGYSMKNDARDVAFLALRTEIEDKLARDEPVYVSFSDQRRHNSVGRIKSCEFTRDEYSANSYYRGRVYNGIHNIIVGWDKRSNKVTANTYDIQYLPEWTHGTQWAWAQTFRTKEAPVEAFDHLGQKIEEGQFVCFVHRRYSNIAMKFGTVSRITSKGSVFVKTLKLRDEDRVEELKALDMDDVCICNDKLMSRLILARMSAQ
jgi:hypothetical protein